MNELALFAGAGGGILGGVLAGFRTVCAVEIDKYCREVLLQRQRDKILPAFPIWDDVKLFDGKPWQGHIQVITAGFPCQPFSIAGKNRKGEADERNMWPDTVRIIGEVRPEWCLLENVPGLLSSGYFGRILSDLAEIGYSARWGCLSASTLGAPHRRERLWIVAHSERMGREKGDTLTGIHEKTNQGRKAPESAIPIGFSETMADAASTRRNHGKFNQTRTTSRPTWWDTEPGVDRMAPRLANRIHRLKALGNGQVPAVVAKAWEMLR